MLAFVEKRAFMEATATTMSLPGNMGDVNELVEIDWRRMDLLARLSQQTFSCWRAERLLYAV